jgi:hypothetical protein
VVNAMTGFRWGYCVREGKVETLPLTLAEQSDWDRNLPDPTKPLGWYDCDHPKNESPNNDGLVNVPPVTGNNIWYSPQGGGPDPTQQQPPQQPARPPQQNKILTKPQAGVLVNLQ